jgi:hypothetical protein
MVDAAAPRLPHGAGHARNHATATPFVGQQRNKLGVLSMTQHEHGQGVGGGSASDRMAQTARSQAEDAQREAQGVAQAARGAAGDVMSEARQAGSALKGEARGVASDLKEQLAAQAEAQKDSLANRLQAIADRVHDTAEDLRGREAWVADLIDRGARELGHVAEDLKHRDVRALTSSFEGFARRQPALFMGAAVALGFALTRVARSGAEAYGRSDRSYDQGYRRGETGYGAATAGYGTGTGSYVATTGGYGSSSSSSSYGAGGSGGYVDAPSSRPDLAQSWPQPGQGAAGTGATGGTAGSTSSAGGGTSDEVTRGSNV